MRWSLILSALIAVQSAISLPLSDELERRSPAGVKISSKQYRENAVKHPDAYHVSGLGPNGKITAETTVTKERIKKGTGYEHARQLKNEPKKNQADHVYERQMFDAHLKDHNLDFKKLDPKVQNNVRNILNGRKNMALVPASINQSKGQLIKHGMQGKEIKRNKARDDYALLSYGTAHKTAAKLDKALREHPGYSAKVKDNTLQKKLHDTFVSAGLKPPSSRSSSRSSSMSTSRSSSSSSSSSRSSSGSRGRSNSPSPGPSRQSNQRPSRAESSPVRGRTTNKRQASPGYSPPRTRQRTGKK